MTNATKIMNDARQYQTYIKVISKPRPFHVLYSFLECKECKCVWDKFMGSIASKKSHIANLNLEEGEKEEV